MKLSLSPKRWLMVAAGGTIVLLGILYFGVISPANSSASADHAKLQATNVEIAADRVQVAHLVNIASHQSAEQATAFRLAAAIPNQDQTPGVILQLQHLASASDVQLSQFRTISTTPVDSLTATAYEVVVTGRFFDVDDFMYRLQQQVSVTPADKVHISGRLFAVTGVQIALATSSNSGASNTDPNSVSATLQLMAFSNGGTAASTTSSSSATSTSGSSSTSTSTSTSGTSTSTATPSN